MTKKTAFIDEVEIHTNGGDGGNGTVSFLRERARPRGGPDGGDGGNGGSVLLTANTAVNTLLQYRYQRRISAVRGERGASKNRHGGNGDNVVLQAPLGTRVFDADTGVLHADLIAAGDTVVLAEGGRGGRGNTRFKSSVNQTPRRATPGEKGAVRRFRLELNLLADIGLVGAPNAGKSSFLRAVSAARPKVADYPFTTLEPQLGYVTRGDGDGIVIADIPGIIQGAADGVGLGNRFLRHLSRTAFLCQVVDAAADSLYEDCAATNAELNMAADSTLSTKPRWLIMNKIDLLSSTEQQRRRAELKKRFPLFQRILMLSALTGEHVANAKHLLLQRFETQ